VGDGHGKDRIRQEYGKIHAGPVIVRLHDYAVPCRKITQRPMALSGTTTVVYLLNIGTTAISLARAVTTDGRHRRVFSDL